MKADSFYEWEAPMLVRLEWVEDGGPLARLIVTCRDGSSDVVEVVAIGRGRMLPAVVEVNVKETP